MHGSQSVGLMRLLFTGLVIKLLALTLSPVSGHAAEPIKIGVIDALSGPAAAFGKQALLGWQMAAEEINAGGGIKGRRVEIIARDDQFSEEKALIAAQELVLNEGVHFLGGTSSSSCALTVSQVAQEQKKIFMVHIARSDRITGEKGHRYVFRACPNSVIEGKAGARYARHKKYLKWFIIGEDYEYGRSIAQGFWHELEKVVPRAEKLGQAWAPLKTEDYSSYIKQMMEKKPSAVYVAFGVSGMTRFLTQAHKAGALDETRLFLNLMADPVLIAQLAGGTLNDNAYGSSGYLWFFPDTLANKKFVQNYSEFAKKEGASMPIPPGFAAFGGYCSAHFLAEAIKKAGTLETEKVIDALEEMTIDTPIGPIRMRGCDHQAMTPTYWGRIQHTQESDFRTLLTPYDVAPEKLLPRCEELANIRK